MLGKRGLFWDELFLSGTFKSLSAELKDEALCYVFRDVCESLPDTDHMKAFYLDYRMGCFSFNEPGRFYYCDCEEDVFDMVVDGAGNPMELLETFSHVTASGEDDIIPLTASLERLNRLVKYLKIHKREDIIEACTIRKGSPKNTNMKQGDEIIVMGNDYCKVVGSLEKLSPKTIYVKVTNPLTCITGKTLQDGCLAVKIDDEWIATEAGEVVAKTLLLELYKELDYLANNQPCVKDFIRNYQDARDSIIAKLKTLTVRELDHYLNLRNELDELLWKMRAETFSEIKWVNMNEHFLKAFSDKFLDGSFLINKEIPSAAAF